MIVVETGTGTDPTANSYADLTTIRARATEFGVTLNADDAILTVTVLKAMRWIETFWEQFHGAITVETQPLSWPRTGACIRGREIDANTLPQLLIDVLVLATAILDAGGSLFQTEAQATAAGGTYVTKEKVGPLELTYGQLTGDTAASSNTLGVAGSLSELPTMLYDLFGSNYSATLTAVRW